MWPHKRSSLETEQLSIADQEASDIAILQEMCAHLDPEEVERTGKLIIDRMDADAEEIAAKNAAGDNICAPFFYVSDEQRAFLKSTLNSSGAKLLSMLDRAARDPRMLGR